ncbi:MAG: hypothetical protein CMB82_08240 [Flammeovirgaceae bacterium]|nr:hypothetical protein [Flammeovirgaceae bacterium]
MVKKIKIILVFLVLGFFIKCGEETLNVSRSQRAEEVGTGIIEEVVDKKGIGMSSKQITWSTRVGRLKPFWYYAWNRDLKENIPDSVEFVPMFWGASSVTDDAIENMKALADAGKVKYILGFNEPDLESQADMSVDEAIALWPKLEKIGVPLGSPAPALISNGWLEEFMSKAVAQNLRVDFVCLHLYKQNNPQLFLDDVDITFEAYGKPIWITEMSVVDDQAETVADNELTYSEVLGTMRALLPGLYSRDHVTRFAWFSATKDSPNFPRNASSILFDEDDNLTELGEYYSRYKPNAVAGSGTDPIIEIVEEVPGNLLQNGTFETGQIDPWLGFKNAVLTATVQEPNTGNYLGRIEPHDGSIYQLITVEPGKTYTLNFFHRFKTTPPNTFNGVLRNEEGDKARFVEYSIPMTDVWTENAIEFTVPEGIQTARLVFYKPQLDPMLPTFFLDDISIIKNP